MTRILVGSAMVLTALTFSAGAEAKGCIKGALVGGLAGHGVLGAAAGCAVGRHEANKRDRQSRQAQPQTAH
ncbi:hypothetical protein [Methylobacterium soli]|uniref:Glycine zipper 2TM domain-containing protein n=1 Tax=Methylobacterium soli TaxID=553447 RepID=A0A6L3SPK7_9HYPH|nr:hypothetical protein [Methylobacterium soli]KAB1071554.1 hypothetical protein F6X53_28980 [Methylobacterium soli]GJE43463.1 hypothetical protein AEGHOMDF_2642 [Methylobacterium soli]